MTPSMTPLFRCRHRESFAKSRHWRQPKCKVSGKVRENGPDDLLVIEMLNKLPHLSTARKVSTFRVTRNADIGAAYTVVVTVEDRGASGPDRFTAIACRQDNPQRATSSNPFPDVQTVLATLHWSTLD